MADYPGTSKRSIEGHSTFVDRPIRPKYDIRHSEKPEDGPAVIPTPRSKLDDPKETVSLEDELNGLKTIVRELKAQAWGGVSHWYDQVLGVPGGGNNGLYVWRHSITAGEIVAQGFTLPAVPATPVDTVMLIRGGPFQQHTKDFTVVGSTVTWAGFPLAGILIPGDDVTVLYR